MQSKSLAPLRPSAGIMCTSSPLPRASGSVLQCNHINEIQGSRHHAIQRTKQHHPGPFPQLYTGLYLPESTCPFPHSHQSRTNILKPPFLNGFDASLFIRVRSKSLLVLGAAFHRVASTPLLILRIGSSSGIAALVGGVQIAKPQNFCPHLKVHDL